MGEEAAGGGVIPAGAQVIEAQVRVPLLAAIEITVGRGACLMKEIAIGVVVVGVGDLAGRAG